MPSNGSGTGKPERFAGGQFGPTAGLGSGLCSKSPANHLLTDPIPTAVGDQCPHDQTAISRGKKLLSFAPYVGTSECSPNSTPLAIPALSGERSGE